MISATKSREMEVQRSIPGGALPASANALPESKPEPCKAKVEAGGESNPRLREITAENGNYAVALRFFRSRVPGEPAMSDCSANELISCLRDAFQRQDFEAVVRALRYQEEGFRREEEVMCSELQARKRELDEVRETQGKKLEEVQRKFEEALVREMECHRQCEVLRERYEDLAEMHRQTKEELDDCERRCEFLLRRERAAQEKLEGLREICGEAFNGEREARKKVAELERKFKEVMASKDERNCRELKSSMEGAGNGAGDRNVERVEAGEGKFIQGMEPTPCSVGCTAKTEADGTELLDDRGGRVRKVLFRSGRELGQDGRLACSPKCEGSSSRVMDLEGSGWAPCTPDGKCQANVGVGLKLAHVCSSGGIRVAVKVGENFPSVSPSVPANNSSQPGEEICRNGTLGNSIPKQMAPADNSSHRDEKICENGTLGNSIPKQMFPELVMRVDRVSDETKVGNATSREANRMEVSGIEERASVPHAMEHLANGVDIERVEADSYAVWIEEEPHETSTIVPPTKIGSCYYPLIDKRPGDRLTTNECSGSEVMTGLQRNAGLTKHVPIVVSDSDSDGESRGVSLRKKARISPCRMKTYSIQTTQCAETESQKRANLTESNPVDEDSDHSQERFVKRTAKCRRGFQNAVISDSESNTSEAAFSCKRRKLKPSSLETGTVHANECGKSDKHDLLNCIGPCNLYESYRKNPKEGEAPKEGESPKEGEVLNASCEPYGATRTDGNLGEEDWGENEKGKCTPDVKFRRLRRVKEVNEHDSQEQGNKCMCSVEEGEYSPAIKFRRLRRVKENECHNSEQAKESPWSIEQGEHVNVLKIRKFRGMAEDNDLHTEKQCNDGKVATVSEVQNISYPHLNVMHSDNIIYTSNNRHSKDGRSPSFTSHKKSAAEVSPGPGTRFSHILATSNSKEQDPIQRISLNKTLDSENCKNNREEFRKVGKESFIKEREDTEVERCRRRPSRSDLPGNKLDQYTITNSNDKAVNLLKESDGEDEEDEVGSDSEGENLGGFIVDEEDESESGTDGEGLNRSKCDTSDTLDLNDSAQNLDSDRGSGSSTSETLLSKILRKLSRKSENMPKWQYEADMLAAFAKDPVLCMRAICALYRQQTNEEQSGKSSLFVNGRGFDKLHALRGSLLAEFLTDGDPFGPVKKSLEELEKYESKGVQFCRNLAFHHSKQLFEIYQKQEDPHFPYG